MCNSWTWHFCQQSFTLLTFVGVGNDATKLPLFAVPPFMNMDVSNLKAALVSITELLVSLLCTATRQLTWPGSAKPIFVANHAHAIRHPPTYICLRGNVSAIKYYPRKLLPTQGPWRAKSITFHKPNEVYTT